MPDERVETIVGDDCKRYNRGTKNEGVYEEEEVDRFGVIRKREAAAAIRGGSRK